MTHSCLGFIPLKTGAIIITIFGILNKLSGFFGLLSMDFSDESVSVVYLYSIVALGILIPGLYGIHTENIRITRWYVLFYWIDCVVSALTSVWFAIKWYAFTDHSLPDLEGDPAKQREHDATFRMESIVSIFFLVLLQLVHIYFAVILTRFYRIIGKTQYSKLGESLDQELENVRHERRADHH